MKKIGLPLWKIGENSFGSTLSYMVYFSKFGEVIPLMPNCSINTELDLLVLPGGADVDPDRYGEYPNFYTSKPDIYKEYFDKNKLPLYIEAGVPVLGICRGHQSLAVHFGSKLIQDMMHETNKENDPCVVVHPIIFDKVAMNMNVEFPEDGTIEVNSRHHQAVHRKQLAESLTPLAYHPGDGLVEMFCHKTLPIVGVQWHPEDVYNLKSAAFTRSIVRYLLKSKAPLIT